MEKEPLIRLTWHGRKTVDEIPQLLQQTERIEITLPANYNHALFRLLYPDTPSSAPEDIDVSDGPELLTDVATLNGLEALAELVAPLREFGASVQVISPPTVVITLPSAESSPE